MTPTDTNRLDLAIAGGSPVRTQPMAPWPVFDDHQIEAVTDVLRSGRTNYWTGDVGRQFENAFSDFTGTEHAVAVANGTVALELALFALEVGPGDEVIVPPRTFVATASAVMMRGATPVFADVDPISQNITRETIEAVITDRTRAVIVVHLAGWPADMDPIMSLADTHNIKIIEDCAQALGATYNGRSVGSIGHVGAFSFCQDKIMTTGGEGGMLTTSDEQIWKRAWSFKDHGKDYDIVYDQKPHDGISFRWLHTTSGTNWRMTEMQAAVGLSALPMVTEWVERRRENAAVLNFCMKNISALRLTSPCAGVGHAYYKYYVFVRPELLAPGWDRTRVAQAVVAEGIPCFTGSCSEIYLEEAFDATARPAERLSTARELGESSLMLLVHPTLTDRMIEDTCTAMNKVFKVAGSQ